MSYQVYVFESNGTLLFKGSIDSDVLSKESKHRIYSRTSPDARSEFAYVKVVPNYETGQGEVECDLIVFATGFDAGRGGLIDMNIAGRSGLTLGEAWKSEIKAYLGMAVARFPNTLFAYGPLSPSGFSNGPTSAEIQGVDAVEIKVIDHLKRELGKV